MSSSVPFGLRIGLAFALLVTATHASIAATITIVNADASGEGFNSTTPRSPEGGNSGTTLGQLRLNVFLRAAQIWGAKLTSNQTIKVESKFDPLECSSSGAVLGSAGPKSVHQFSTAGNPSPKANTWYPMALAEAIASSNLNGTGNEIGATFNSDLDTGCLSGVTWWYGTSSSVSVPAGKISLLPVVLHELGHGLGFLTLADESNGTLFNGSPDIWTHFLRDRDVNLLWKDMSNAQRQASAINDPDLVWDGSNVNAAIPTFLPSGAGVNGTGSNARVRMYAPSPVEPGSSVSHWTTAASPNLLMEPNITSTLFDQTDLTDHLFRDIGWIVATGASNQAPSITAPASINVTEDTLTILTGISFADADAGSNSVLATFSIPAASGSLAGSAASCSGVTIAAPDAFTRRLTGSISNINACISGGNIRFTPNQDATSAVTLTVNIDDQGHTGLGGPLTAQRTVSLTIQAVNDAPTLTLTNPQSINEDATDARIAGISIADVDAGNAQTALTITISAGGGALAWNPVCSGTSPTGNATSLTITGNITAVQNCLTNGIGSGPALRYTPVLNQTGNATLAITINDNGNTGSGGAKTASGNLTISIVSQNDAPTITLPANLAVNEDSSNTSLAGLVLGDVDAGAGSVTALFTINSGALDWNPVCSGTSNSGTATALQITGTVAAIQACLLNGNGLGNPALRFTPVPNNTAPVTLSVSLNDNGNSGAGGAKSASANTTINITASNDAPSLNVPTLAAIQEDASSVSLPGIIINDVDAGTGSVELRVSIVSGGGTLDWNPVCSGTSPSGTASNRVISGTLSAIQACLTDGNGLGPPALRYSPALHFNGAANLQFIIDDKGNTGTGGALTATTTQNITVNAVNDAPGIAAPVSLNANLLGSTRLLGITLSDVDSAEPGGTWTFSITAPVDSGVLHLERDGVFAPGCNSTEVQLPSGNDVSTLTMSGPLNALQSCLNQGAVSWLAPDPPPASVNLSLSLNDGGHFGTGGVLNDSDAMILNVVNLFGDGFE